MQPLKIGIHGKARSGKDTIAKYLIEHHGFIRNAFADPLKRAAQQMFMLTEEQTWSDALKEVVIPYWDMSPRQMFQKLGTEGGRDLFGDELWLRRWNIHFETFGPKCNYTVPDVRFANEGTYLRKLGFTIIHVSSNRPAALVGATAKHSSERPIPFKRGSDVRLANDGSFKDLYVQLDSLVDILKDGIR